MLRVLILYRDIGIYRVKNRFLKALVDMPEDEKRVFTPQPSGGGRKYEEVCDVDWIHTTSKFKVWDTRDVTEWVSTAEEEKNCGPRS